MKSNYKKVIKFLWFVNSDVNSLRYHWRSSKASISKHIKVGCHESVADHCSENFNYMRT